MHSSGTALPTMYSTQAKVDHEQLLHSKHSKVADTDSLLLMP